MALTYQQMIDYIKAHPNQPYLDHGEVEKLSTIYRMPGENANFAIMDNAGLMTPADKWAADYTPTIKWMADRNGRDWNENMTYYPDGTSVAGTDHSIMNTWLDKNIGTIGGLMLAGMGGYAALNGLGALGAGAGATEGVGGVASSGGGGFAGTAASGAGGFAIPTAEELAAGGFGAGGGMGLTGAGGIGAADSLVASGIGGSAGYGAAAAGGGALSGLGSFLGSKGGAALAGGLLSGISSLSAPKSTTATSAQQIDPRMASILYGDGTAQNPGFLNRALQVANQPQNAGMAAFGNGMANYLGSNGMSAFGNSMNTAQSLQGSNIGAPTAQAAQVNAPSQNNMNLSPAYQQMIYGDSAQNPYLQGALQKGVNQANTAFGNMAHDYGQALQDNLAGIRSGAIVNGSMGSSRQGIAEGKAFDGYNTGMSRALSQYGQNVTDNIMGAQANAYESGQNRALSAMSGLGAQQYGVAGQNASMQQQSNLANLQSQLSTNALNSENQRAGVGLTSGLLGQASGYGQNQDSYNMNKLGQVGGLLSPFTGLNNTQSTTQPLYQNTLGNIAGGALAGASIYNMLNK